MNNYKGIFYKEEKEKKYFEGGAHFKYSELVFELNKLIIEKNKIKVVNTTKDSKDNLLLSGNYKNYDEGKKIQGLLKERNKKKLNFLTLKNQNIHHKERLIINKENKLILKTEKNFENKENNKFLTLITKNMKMSPLKTNPNNKKIYSIDKIKNNNYNMKTLENNSYKKDIYKNISLYINHIKEKKSNDLPIIKDFHFNNFSNRNIFKTKKNNLFNSKLDSKIETSKYNNLFLKNKAFSPIKNIQSKKDNKLLSLDFSEPKNNKNTIDTVTSYKNQIFFHKGKLSKYFKNEVNKQKNNPNINIINLVKMKKSDV